MLREYGRIGNMKLLVALVVFWKGQMGSWLVAFGAAINSFSPTLASVVNCDHSLPQRLKAAYAREGSYSEWMHDSGAGKTHISPFYSDFAEFTSITPAFFGGIGGGSSMSPASDRVDIVQLDVDGRPYVYSLPDVRYSPGCVERLFACEPERELGHHVRSDLMAQLRADGASIPLRDC